MRSTIPHKIVEAQYPQDINKTNEAPKDGENEKINKLNHKDFSI